MELHWVDPRRRVGLKAGRTVVPTVAHWDGPMVLQWDSRWVRAMGQLMVPKKDENWARPMDRWMERLLDWPMARLKEHR